ncbi:MAG: hypothetical protein K8L97_04260 [Anaerolineae bacterium]|nr:hypothetical protein [Anaerolineae bacterium]
MKGVKTRWLALLGLLVAAGGLVMLALRRRSVTRPQPLAISQPSLATIQQPPDDLEPSELNAHRSSSVIRYLLPVVEIGLVLVVSLVAARYFITADPTYLYSGGEAEWLTSPAYAAHDGLQQHGRIPLWQPLFEAGEPLLENPFAFIFNPFSSVPSLLLGGESGIRVSIVLTACIAGLGGWFLGHMLGLSLFGRLLLGLLLIGKGNMHAMLNTGYFQLGVSQAYIPWVIGSTLAVLRVRGKRWPVPLLAVSVMLLYFAGNLWYVLPTVVGAGLVALIYLVRTGKHIIDWGAIGRLLLAGGLVLVLSAVTLLPLIVNFERIGKHPPEIEAGFVVPLWENILPLYINPDRYQIVHLQNPLDPFPFDLSLYKVDEFYFSFVAPLWFVGLLLILPPYRLRFGHHTRLWWLALILFVLATLWGAGGQPLFIWLYQNISLLGQWRFVGRALGVGAFWLALLIALRADQIWLYFQKPSLNPVRAWGKKWAVVLLFLAGGFAAADSMAQWDASQFGVLRPLEPTMNNCLERFRLQNPDRQLTVWQGEYKIIRSLLRYRVRTWDIQADFEMNGIPGDFEANLAYSLPEYLLIWNDDLARNYLVSLPGYEPVMESRYSEIGLPCLYRNPKALSYAYTLPADSIPTPLALQIPIPFYGDFFDLDSFPPGTVTPITSLNPAPDQIIAVVTQPRASNMLLTAQERAYPGWQAEINGQPVPVQSFGGQVSVELPPGDDRLQIVFVYRPPLLMTGGLLTLLSAVSCIVYLAFGKRPLFVLWSVARRAKSVLG